MEKIIWKEATVRVVSEYYKRLFLGLVQIISAYTLKIFLIKLSLMTI